MSTPMKAAEDIRNLATRFRSILEVAEVLEKIGSLEQAERDANQRIENALNAETQAKNQLKTATDILESKIAEVESAQQKATETKERAESTANSIVLAAEEKAKQIIAEAESRKNKILSETAGHQKALSQIQHKIDEKNQELNDIKVKIDETKARISAL